MLDYDCPNEILARATAITPGHRGADGQPAADARLVGGAGDGARRPRPTGSWTSSGSSAPAPSWSPASTPPASEAVRVRAATRRRSRASRRRAACSSRLPLLALLTGCAGVRAPAARTTGRRTGGRRHLQADNDLQVVRRPRRRHRARELDADLRRASPRAPTPTPQAACAHLAGMDDPFAPLPDDVACTEQYGGPETAHVTGRWGGEPVDLELSRTDGCRIAQWDCLGPLLPPSAPVDPPLPDAERPRLPGRRGARDRRSADARWSGRPGRSRCTGPAPSPGRWSSRWPAGGHGRRERPLADQARAARPRTRR